MRLAIFLFLGLQVHALTPMCRDEGRLRSDFRFDYTYQNSISSPVDFDFTQKGDKVVAVGGSVKSYGSDSVAESSSISATALSVAVGEGPGLKRYGWAKQVGYTTSSDIVLGSQTFSVDADECNRKLVMPTGANWAATVCKQGYQLFYYDGSAWQDRGKTALTTAVDHDIDIDINHEDYMIVRGASVSILKLGAIVEEVLSLSGDGKVATSVNCRGSVFAIQTGGSIALKQLNQKTLAWSDVGTVSGDTVQLSSDVMAVGGNNKVTLHMFSKSEIYEEYKVFDGENNFGKQIALKHDHLAIADDSKVSFFSNTASTKCFTNQKLVDGACVNCGAGHTNGFENTETTCTAKTCAANKFVSNGACQECVDGTSDGPVANAGDTECICDAGSAWNATALVCSHTICADNEKVVSNECVPCDPGKVSSGADAHGSDTSCSNYNCLLNENVVSNLCTPCPEGSTNGAGDSQSGADTACDPNTPCSTNTFFDAIACVSCPLGTFKTGGSNIDPSPCEPNECLENEHVSNGACQACADGVRPAGDLTNAGDTACMCPVDYNVEFGKLESKPIPTLNSFSNANKWSVYGASYDTLALAKEQVANSGSSWVRPAIWRTEGWEGKSYFGIGISWSAGQPGYEQHTGRMYDYRYIGGGTCTDKADCGTKCLADPTCEGISRTLDNYKPGSTTSGTTSTTDYATCQLLARHNGFNGAAYIEQKYGNNPRPSGCYSQSGSYFFNIHEPSQSYPATSCSSTYRCYPMPTTQYWTYGPKQTYDAGDLSNEQSSPIFTTSDFTTPGVTCAICSGNDRPPIANYVYHNKWGAGDANNAMTLRTWYQYGKLYDLTIMENYKYYPDELGCAQCSNGDINPVAVGLGEESSCKCGENRIASAGVYTSTNMNNADMLEIKGAVKEFLDITAVNYRPGKFYWSLGVCHNYTDCVAKCSPGNVAVWKQGSTAWQVDASTAESSCNGFSHFTGWGPDLSPSLDDPNAYSLDSNGLNFNPTELTMYSGHSCTSRSDCKTKCDADPTCEGYSIKITDVDTSITTGGGDPVISTEAECKRVIEFEFRENPTNAFGQGSRTLDSTPFPYVYLMGCNFYYRQNDDNSWMGWNTGYVTQGCSSGGSALINGQTISYGGTCVVGTYDYSYGTASGTDPDVISAEKNWGTEGKWLMGNGYRTPETPGIYRSQSGSTYYRDNLGDPGCANYQYSMTPSFHRQSWCDGGKYHFKKYVDGMHVQAHYRKYQNYYTCEDCPAGSTIAAGSDPALGAPSENCLCGAGTYNPSCASCPSDSTNAGGDDPCVCNAGFRGVLTDNAGTCTQCTADSTNAGGDDPCVCNDGFEGDETNCNACPANSNAVGSKVKTSCSKNENAMWYDEVSDINKAGACLSTLDCSTKAATTAGCIQPYEDGYSVACCQIETPAPCTCAENHRVLDSQCVACLAGETRAAGDNPDNGKTYCGTSGIVKAFTDVQDHYVHEGNNDPTITLNIGTQYTFIRDSPGHVLRIVSAADCTGCSSGERTNLPASALPALPDAEQGVANIVWTPDAPGTYYYICISHPKMVGMITVAWKDCGIPASSSGPKYISESCQISNQITLAGDLSLQPPLGLRSGALPIVSIDLGSVTTAFNTGSYQLTLKNIKLSGLSDDAPVAESAKAIVLDGVHIEGNGEKPAELFKVSTVHGSILAKNIVVSGTERKLFTAAGGATIAVADSTLDITKDAITQDGGAVLVRDVVVTGTGKLASMTDSTSIFEAVTTDVDIDAVNSAVQIERSSFSNSKVNFDSSGCSGAQCKRQLIVSETQNADLEIKSDSSKKPTVKVIEGNGTTVNSNNGADLYVIDPVTEVTSNDSPKDVCLPYQCSHKPLASTCEVVPGKGTQCTCKIGVATYNDGTMTIERQTHVEEILAVLFATAGTGDRIVKLIDQNQRYVPTHATPAAARSNILLTRPVNVDGHFESEKTILMKPDTGSVCATFQTWLCAELTACHFDNGTITAECDGTTIHVTNDMPARRLFGKLRAVHPQDPHCDGAISNLRQQCSYTDSTGNLITYERCVEHAQYTSNICECTGDKTSNGDGTKCIDANSLCDVNEHVQNERCVSCSSGTQNAAGDDKYGGDTTCNDVICGESERVSGGVCVACLSGEFNLKGDVAVLAGVTQSDTTCCAAEKYEYSFDSANGARVCKECDGSDGDQSLRSRFNTGLKCCGKSNNVECDRLMEYWIKVCDPARGETCPA